MRIHVISIILFAFCCGLLASASYAQDLDIPDKARRQEMSYEEYTALREKMRERMESMSPTERRELREKWQEIRRDREELREKIQEIRRSNRNEERSYGEGYHARRHNTEKTEIRPDKPDIPQRMERPNLPQRMERFQRP